MKQGPVFRLDHPIIKARQGPFRSHEARLDLPFQQTLVGFVDSDSTQQEAYAFKSEYPDLWRYYSQDWRFLLDHLLRGVILSHLFFGLLYGAYVILFVFVFALVLMGRLMSYYYPFPRAPGLNWPMGNLEEVMFWSDLTHSHFVVLPFVAGLCMWAGLALWTIFKVFGYMLPVASMNSRIHQRLLDDLGRSGSYRWLKSFCFSPEHFSLILLKGAHRICFPWEELLSLEWHEVCLFKKPLPALLQGTPLYTQVYLRLQTRTQTWQSFGFFLKTEELHLVREQFFSPIVSLNDLWEASETRDGIVN